MLVALLGRRHGPAELALEAVDGGAQAPGIDEIVVGVTLEILDRRLELDEFIKHVAIIRTYVWYVHVFSANLYSRQATLQSHRARLGHPFTVFPFGLTLAPDGATPTQAHIRTVPGQGAGDLSGRAQVRDRHQHPPC